MHLRLQLLLVMALCLGLPSPGFSQFPDLASKVHDGANVIVAIDVAALQEAPLAKEHGWSKKLEAKFADRAIYLPPEADKLLVASFLAPNQEFHQDWEIAIIKLTEPLSMRAVARAEGGYVDKINEKEVVWSPSDAYLVGLDKETLGIVSPAQRQSVSRWLDEVAKNRSDNLSPYLQTALSKVTPDSQIVMAIDLKDTVAPHRVADRLKDSETLQKSSLKLEDVVALMQTIQGATIEVSIGSKASAKSRIDFGQPVTMSDAVAKRLVLEALERLGVQVTDLADHQFSTLGNSIIVEGDLSSGGLRRLLSVLEIPTTKFSELEEETDESHAPSAGDMAENSQTYFKSVVALLDDLRGSRSKQDDRGGMDAVWMERYARKIDRLPILYVDEDLLEFGSKTAETLRIMAGARRGAGLSAGSQKSALRESTGAYGGGYYNYSYGYQGAGYGGGSDAAATEMDRNQIDRQAQNQATSTKAEGWRLIEDATAGTRRQMTQRYNVEF